jgi:hypothetical protein
MRRIVETHRHLRESQMVCMAKFLSPNLVVYRNAREGLYRPHTGKVTVSRTGTLPPSSCGKGPTAVGESVMVLPGSPRNPATRLTRKGSDRESWKTAARVLGAWESHVQGERRQSRELRVYSECEGAEGLGVLHRHVRRTAQQQVSARTALEGKPDALKGARPVWEEAR